MKHKLKPLLAAALLAGGLFIAGCSGGCKSSKLGPGGAYAPTNAVGEVISSDKELALADGLYKFAYETALGVSKLERDNRQAIWDISPEIKKALDKVRPDLAAIDLRWAKARHAYKKNPTPEGLTTLQQILAEINRLLPVMQSQIVPIQNAITQPR